MTLKVVNVLIRKTRAERQCWYDGWPGQVCAHSQSTQARSSPEYILGLILGDQISAANSTYLVFDLNERKRLTSHSNTIQSIWIAKTFLIDDLKFFLHILTILTATGMVWDVNKRFRRTIKT